MCQCQGKHTDWPTILPWSGTIVTFCMSYFVTGGPDKHRTNKPPPTGRVQKRSKVDTTCPATSQNPSHWHPFWLNNECTTRNDLESEWLAKDNPKTNPITIKPEAVSHVAEQFSWVSLLSCSPPGHSLPVKSLAHVSPQIIHLWVLDKRLLLGPRWGPPSCNIRISFIYKAE